MKTLHVLNDAYLVGNKRCLCGDEVAIADFFSIANVILGERIGVNLTDYPNVERWVNNLKER